MPHLKTRTDSTKFHFLLYVYLPHLHEKTKYEKSSAKIVPKLFPHLCKHCHSTYFSKIKRQDSPRNDLPQILNQFL